MEEKAREKIRGEEGDSSGVDYAQHSINRLRQEVSAMLQEIARQLAADVVTLLLYDAVTNKFYLPIGHGLQDSGTFEDSRMLPRTNRLAGTLVRERRPIIEESVIGHWLLDGPFTRRERIISAAGFPLIYADEVVGILFVSYRSTHSFTDTDKTAIAVLAQQMAATIAKANIFPILRQQTLLPKTDEELALQAIIDIGCNLTNKPFAIWILDSLSQRLHIWGMTGLILSYITEASASVGDGSMISHIVQTGEPQVIQDIRRDSRFRYPNHAQKAGWVSVLGFPIKLRGHVRGVIEFFSFESGDIDQAHLETYQRLAELTSAILENTYRSREAQRLAEVAHTLSAAPGFSRAIQVIVETARELTAANSSVLFFLEKKTNSFVVGGYASASEEPKTSLPRSNQGLTCHIIETGEAIKIDDISQDRRVRESLIHEGVRSLIGVRVQVEGESIGVLYIYGKRRSQFTGYDMRILQILADQASVPLIWSKLLLKPSNEIEQAISNLFRLEAVLDNFCHEIQSLLRFDFAAVQLIRPEENTIETVYEVGMVEQWTGLVKHSLEQNPNLRDIQADIAMTGHTEIIAGWDERFDRWVYDVFHHEQLVRIFTPIVLIRDENGKVIDNWFDSCRWEITVTEENKKGQHTVIEMRLDDLSTEGREFNVEVIGTVEAGYRTRQKHIEAKEGIALAKLVAQYALIIRSSLLPYVLETIVEHAMKIVQGDAASLHFLYDSHRHSYIYQVAFGHLGLRFLKILQPRQQGLGRQAIQAREPKFIPDPSQGHSDLELSRLNPIIFGQGIRAIIAFPFLVGEREGVFYINFYRPHRFTPAEIGWLQLFANQAVDAIRHATMYMQMHVRANQLSTLHSVTQSLVIRPEGTDLLQYIAGSTLNIFAADIVTINEYTEGEKRFYDPPAIAGRLIDKNNISSQIREFSAPILLVEHGSNIYAEVSAANTILNNFAHARLSSFVIREKIASSAGILLKVGAEIVGTMFINYRRYHNFTEEEKQIMDILASSAAIAIKNQRLLDTLRAGDREIITTLDLKQLLNLIVRRAVHITGADSGDIRLLDPINQELVMQAKYPADALVDSTWTRTRLGEGITGWVAAHGLSALVYNVQVDARYRPYFRDMCSELCVPLLNRDGHILGVLNVESRRTAVFNLRDQRTLESLANQAVIAIQNAENQEQLVATETIATLGDLAGQLLHRTNNDVGAIRVWSQELQKFQEVDAQIKEIATEIHVLAEHIIRNVRELNEFILQSPQPLNLREIIIEALGRVQLPPRISYKNKVPSNLPRVSGGEQQLINAFVNLIQNAVDAMQGHGTLSLKGTSVRQAGKRWIIIELQDTGTGIAEEELAKIFERNYSTKDAGKGLGFGLWWTRAYIKRLGGQLSVESQLGQGSKFIVRLPAFEPKHT